MKKLKILTVLGVLLAMGVTACNKGGEETPAGESTPAAESQPAGNSQGGGQSSQGGGGGNSQAHTKHTWDNGEITTEPTCEEPGVKTFKCTYEGCTETRTEAVAPNGHTWGQAQEVAAGGEGLEAIRVSTCTVEKCGAKRIEVAVANAKVTPGQSGGGKKEDANFPGYIKLNKNTDFFELAFNYTGYAIGKVYQRGVMDHWHDNTANESRGYFSGNNTSTTHADENGNFLLEINDVAVDISGMKNKTYGDMFPAEANSVGSNMSQLADCEVGAIKLHEGTNTIKFTRVDSFNLLIKDIVFVVKDQADHTTHEMPEQWTVVKEATCTADGLQRKVCPTCGYKVEEVIPAGHKWGAEEDVAADTESGAVAYKRAVCSGCGAVKYTILSDDATFATGSSNKSGTPEHHIKLNSNGQSFSVKFKTAKVSVGTLYQEGVFDVWPSNGEKYGYFDVTKSDANAEQAKKTGNFEVKVNGSVVDLEPQRGKVFADWLDTETKQTIGEGNAAVDWSLDGLCPIGEVDLDVGVNEIVYKRVESYNLAVKSFVLIVNESDHVHAKADVWTSDGVGHWHACTAANCPVPGGKKFDYAAHTLEADTSKTDVDATCSQEGTHYVKCSICEKELEQPIEKLPHTWIADDSKTDVPATCAQEGIHYVKCSECGATEEQPIAKAAHAWVEGTVAQNSDGKNVTPLSCSNSCGKVGAKIAVADYSSATIDIGLKFKKNSDNVWKIIAPKAGTYEIRISAKIDAVNTGHNLSESPVTVKVGETSVAVSTASFGELGVGTSSVAEFVLVPQAEFVEGENVITLSQGNGGYRLTYGGDIVICEL